MKIVKNPNKEVYEKITKLVEENDNYCPCSLVKNKDTLCICKEFIESKVVGFCHCQRYYKEEV